jgi:N-acetylglucosamine kinase-like BadF-type ATPase
MTGYVIAADGGNSKTDVVLSTVDGEVLARVQGNGTRPQVTGMDPTARDLAAMVQEAREQAALDRHARILTGAFYLANVDIPAEEHDAMAALQRLKVAEDLVVSNDVFAVLRAGSLRDWGVAVTAGAGVNAVGVHPNGTVARFLSLGDITGDWGGGHAVGVAGLGAAVRAEDGRGEDTKLTLRVAEHFSQPTAGAVALAIHNHEIPYTAVHTLAPVVFRTASEGDAVAREIVLRLGDEVATMATTLLRRLQLLHSYADVVLGGGTLQSGNDILIERIHALMRDTAPNVHVTVLDVPPVAGALIEALEMAGASAAAQLRAREAFR